MHESPYPISKDSVSGTPNTRSRAGVQSETAILLPYIFVGAGMRRNMRFQTFMVGIALAGVMAPANAQWVNYPEPGTPLTRDGKPNLLGKAPRALNGKPDLSGV